MRDYYHLCSGEGLDAGYREGPRSVRIAARSHSDKVAPSRRRFGATTYELGDPHELVGLHPAALAAGIDGADL